MISILHRDKRQVDFPKDVIASIDGEHLYKGYLMLPDYQSFACYCLYFILQLLSVNVDYHDLQQRVSVNW